MFSEREHPPCEGRVFERSIGAPRGWRGPLNKRQRTSRYLPVGVDVWPFFNWL